MSLTEVNAYERLSLVKKFISGLAIKKHKVILKLKIKNFSLTTAQFPSTILILEKYLPTIFNNQCFNPQGFTFRQEVLNTELGHLFEHILIENMCLIKIKYTDQVIYNARTYWDLDKNNGEFRIEIHCDIYDWPVFIKALLKSILLMDIILQTRETKKRAAVLLPPSL